MQPIHVRRFGTNPHGHQGEVEAADGSWRVLIDKNGHPQLWFRVRVEDDAQGKPQHAHACVDDFLDEDLGTVADIMQSQFSGTVPEGEEIEAEKYWNDRWAKQDGTRCCTEVLEERVE